MKRISKIITLLLSSLLLLLGFSSCRSSKNVIKEKDKPKQIERDEPIRLLYGTPSMMYQKNITE